MLHRDADREYFRCGECHLAFLHPDRRLSYEDEIARYALHQNRPDDPGYLAFLGRLADPIIAATAAGARGLDFGCGPAPVLGDILTRSGRTTSSYDPGFHPHERLLADRYDFLTCSEVLEHVHEPLPFLMRLGALVPRGVIGVMTRLLDGGQVFGEWWYRRDPTHVCFYSRATIDWIGERFHWRVEHPAANVALFHT